MSEARPFADAAFVLAEHALEGIDAADPDRAWLTRLTADLRTEAGALAQFRKWMSNDPNFTAALVRAGRQHARRVQTLVEGCLKAEARRAA